jgi:ABC-2 type transport system ATP-binding protein
MLQIRELSKTYANSVQALKNVSLEIPNGMFGLLGPNGAGKSTLMRTIATLQDADSGSIRLNDLDVLADKPAARRLLGYLPQEFGVYPKVSAEAMLDHFAVLKGVVARGERKAVVEALLRQVNLWEVRKRKLGTFSGGMRQRFGLSTHIVEDVTDLCPRMAIISQGQVLLSGQPAEAMRSLDGRVWRRTVPNAAIEDYRNRFMVLSTRLAGGKTLVHVLADSKPEEGFDAVAADLEDVYFGQLRRQAASARAA